jgi:hypothetical protein
MSYSTSFVDPRQKLKEQKTKVRGENEARSNTHTPASTKHHPFIHPFTARTPACLLEVEIEEIDRQGE